MARRGRKPKPEAVKRLDGNPGRRPLSALPARTAGQAITSRAADGAVTVSRVAPTAVAELVAGQTLPVGAPAPPEWLDPEAKAEWQRISVELAVHDVLAPTLRAALENYCRLYGRWREIEGLLDRTRGVGGEPALLLGKEGAYQVNPLQYESRAIAKQLREWLVEFGLTPSGAARVGARKAVDEADELLLFVRQRKTSGDPLKAITVA